MQNTERRARPLGWFGQDWPLVFAPRHTSDKTPWQESLYPNVRYSNNQVRIRFWDQVPLSRAALRRAHTLTLIDQSMLAMLKHTGAKQMERRRFICTLINERAQDGDHYAQEWLKK